MKKIVFIACTNHGIQQALILQKEFPKSVIVSVKDTTAEEVTVVPSLENFIQEAFHHYDGICFVSALGICVRMIAPLLQDKRTDPAVLCMDDQGNTIQSVISGHLGGANDFARKVAQITGGQAIISTSSDQQKIWALDELADKWGWVAETNVPWNTLISTFVNNRPTALLLDVRDKGTDYLEQSLPSFVTCYYTLEEIDFTHVELFIAVTYKQYTVDVDSLFFYPPVLTVGSGCSRKMSPILFQEKLEQQLVQNGIALPAIKAFGSIDIKQDQQAYIDWAKHRGIPFETFSAEQLEGVETPNPSEVVREKIGVDGVSEASALLLANTNQLLIEKQKVLLDDQRFTFAVALASAAVRSAEIAIIGAGPGDEELITVKGKRYLEQADLVLYAGSLVPEEMTNWCKQGAIVRNSASMTLEEQLDLMQEHYRRGNAIVRLHSGDPSIYGAVQEQMSLFDDLGMRYFIVPGISSFNAAAAVLKSEFTIPEVVQTIIITRGEGKTPLPSAERLEDMAKLKATICLFLSAGIAKKVESQLLKHYEPDTPVAVLYRLTWKDEEVYQGKLADLASIVKASKKKRTVLIIVGYAIGARKNRSQLYSPDWKHIFRTNKKFKIEG